MSGESRLGAPWFIVLLEDGHPVEAIQWKDWTARSFDERPMNAHLVFAKDEMDAFVRAQRGEAVRY